MTVTKRKKGRSKRRRAVRASSTRKTVRVVAFLFDDYDTASPYPFTLKKFMARISRDIAEIPEKYRDAAEVEIDWGSITVFYRRPETDRERADRVKCERIMRKYTRTGDTRFVDLTEDLT